MNNHPGVILGGEKLSTEEAKSRHSLLLDSMVRISAMAHRALYQKGLSRDEFVMVCIAVDSQWRDVVDMIMPGADWQQYRDQGQRPIARGSVSFGLCRFLGERLPSIKDVLMEVPPEGLVKVVVLDDTGGTVYDIEPKPEGMTH